MNKITKWVRQVPGWLILVVIFGGLYLTGLHTEVIGQAQRLLLATGLIKPNVPAATEPAASKLTGIADSSGTPEPAFPPADYSFNLQTLQGESVSLKSLKGKVVFMNFWATWCPPCVAEMPNIQSLYEKMPADQVAFVMVSLDDNPPKAGKFIAKKGFTFPVYMPAGPVPQAYASQVIPTTFVISPDGRVMARHDGMADYDNASFRDFLLKLAQRGGDKVSTGSVEVVSPDTPAAGAKTISSQQAKALLAQQPAINILDVRTHQEFSGGHLENALNLDYNSHDFQTKLLNLDKTKPYLVYCAVGGRSSKAARLMQELGFLEVYNVSAGFPELKSTGLPLAK